MELKPGYKQTEVGVIPEGWNDMLITETTKAIFLGLTSKVDYVSIGGVPLVRASDIAEGRLRFETARSISDRQHQELTKYRRAKRGDVLVSKSGSLGVCAIVDVDTEFSIYESIIVLQPNDILDPLFLLSLLRDESTQHRMISDRVGSTVGHLNLEVFRRLVIPVPPLPEQRAIAEALSDVDALLAALDRLIAKQRDLKQATIQQLLTGQTRLPGFTGEWEVKRLGALGYFLKGNGIKKDEAQSGDLPCIRYGEIYTHHDDYIKSFNSWISPQVAQKATLLKQGDILFAGSSETKEEIGKCVAFVDNFKAYAGGDVVILRPTSANSMFLGYYCNTFAINLQKASKGQGDAVVHISANALSSIEVTIPNSIAEQTAIAAVLADMDAELTALEQRRDKTRLLKQAMMQELLTGRTRLVG